MKKIPSLFERDWEGDRSRVVDKVNPDCKWVLDGEGRPTVKLDGSCCLVRDGKLYKRRELHGVAARPAGFEETAYDATTDKVTGWVPVGDGPEDRWHREALEGKNYPDGTYELLGPKVQGNPENFEEHTLVLHGSHLFVNFTVPRTFDGLRNFFATTETDIEGIVFHHPDGRMAKIKLKDFGLKRTKAPS